MCRAFFTSVCILVFFWAAPASGLDIDPSDQVIGLSLRGEHRAYPLRLFELMSAVNDEVGPLAVIVFYDSGSDYAAAFFRLIGGEPLEFSGQALGTVADDLTSATRWDMVTGHAVSGNLVGQKLVPIPIRRASLSDWLNSYPHSTVFNP